MGVPGATDNDAMADSSALIIDAVLLPTLSDKARYTNDEIADYFVGFLKKKPDGKILEGNGRLCNWR